MKKLLGHAFFAALVGAIACGCASNPTNEPSEADINKAVQRKLDAIDNDTTLTADQKAEMKKHIGGPVGSGGSTTSTPAGGPPPDAAGPGAGAGRK